MEPPTGFGAHKLRGDSNAAVAVVGFFFACCAHAVKLELGQKITHASLSENCLDYVPKQNHVRLEPMSLLGRARLAHSFPKKWIAHAL